MQETAADDPGEPGTTGGAALVGARLRTTRLAQRRTVAEVAEASGLTKGFLSRLERDRATASVAALVRLCTTLDLAVGSLFTPAPAGEVLRAGHYPPITFGGHGLRESLLTPVGERRVAVIVSELDAGGGSGEEPYGLDADVEFALVLAGEIELRFAGPDPAPAEDVVLSAGDAFTFDPARPHSFRATANGPARVLWVVSPALSDPPRRSA
ncbi:helix-turn-helix domain-containing protein [Kineococcus rhizosphaerae]|uniref:XRE family transcriptional regulator n=1 Tax=Kineococcus rhizosphaerae TaxID=559628 RepID=A0A2T0RBL5_9ACTN|nr:XRE family transcriptional regulator [Kineococcus rhizosphaerae]PRY18566.1 XRE family transcriptional regulator [Kineococcus rhizosphaerae]